MKIAIYSRVSDDKKKDDGSRRQDINRQIEYLTPIANSRMTMLSCDAVEHYADDGKSAFTDDWNSRPEFKRLINDCRRHYIKEIIIEDMTRFSRRIDLGLPILRELGQIGVNVFSLKEGEIEVTTSQGWLKSSILLMFSEWDSRVKSEKVKNGMQKAKNLRKHIGRPKTKGGGTKPATNPL